MRISVAGNVFFSGKMKQMAMPAPIKFRVRCPAENGLKEFDQNAQDEGHNDNRAGLHARFLPIQCRERQKKNWKKGKK